MAQLKSPNYAADTQALIVMQNQEVENLCRIWQKPLFVMGSPPFKIPAAKIH